MYRPLNIIISGEIKSIIIIIIIACAISTIYFLTDIPFTDLTGGSRWWRFNSHYRQPGFLQPQV
jgi:hypothetical protein